MSNLITWLYVMTIIAKTIQIPFKFTISPADFLLPIVIIWIGVRCYKNTETRHIYIKNRVVQLLFALLVWVIFTVICQWTITYVSQIELKYNLTSVIISIAKFLMVMSYYLIGLYLSSVYSRERFAWISILSSVVFSIIGIMAVLVQFPAWGALGYRLVSTLNDPNIASWILNLNIILAFSLISKKN